ncbi:calmodulin-like protein 3 [Heracleum sosnowskyi]|uniref:Calmodulin-like protein 3 n=1 Tax=Heracleum sosnowskyi TaxID=360622 RepID=A0AAD8N8V5_9APIA|nr:calmodulin-like protein 3 [Heracleum sosnowskyi]
MLISYIFLPLLFVIGLFATYFVKFSTKNLATDVQKNNLNVQKTEIKNKSVAATTNGGNKNNVHYKDELKSVFATFDKNSDGYITSQELKESLKNIGITMSDKDVKEMVEKVDANGDNLIDIDEFCTLFESIMSTSNVEEVDAADGEVENEGGYLKEAFNVFDEDGDGVITVEELGMVLSSLGFKEGKLLESCKEMIRKVDVDGDGKINFDEFKTMMKAGSKFLPVS